MPGGYFPIGENSVWHGGVHLRTGGLLRAPLAGRLVAARLAEGGEGGEGGEATMGHYGSRNFLLIEHRVPVPSGDSASERRFFTLLMHLRPRTLRAGSVLLQRYDWLRQSRKQIGLRVTTAGLNYRSEPRVHEETWEGELSKGDLLVPRPGAPRAEALLEGRGDTDWQFVRVPTGAGAFVYCSDEHVEPAYEATIDEDLLEKLRGGGVVDLDFEVEAGAPLWEIGEYGSPDYRARLVHWEVFSEERLFVDETAATYENGHAAAENNEDDARRFLRVTARRGVDVYAPDYTAFGGPSRMSPVGRLSQGTIVEITSGSEGDPASGPCWVQTEEMSRDRGERGMPVFIEAADRAEKLAPSDGWQRRGAWVTGVRRLTAAHAHAGQTARFEARLRVADPTAAERAQVSWEIRLGGRVHERRERAGARLSLEITEAMRGQTLAAYPYLSRVEEDITAEVEVTDLPLLRWQAAEDGDGNYNLDAAAVQQVVADFAAEGGEAHLLEREEIQAFYASTDTLGARVALRGYACKFVSEWGIPDLEKAVDDLWGKGWLRKVFAGYEEKIRPYLWWQEALEAGVDLPASPHVWHYNPIAVLQQLYHEGYGLTQPLVWGAKVSAAFRRKVVQICEKLDVDPNYLMAAMAFETGETFSPSVSNPVSTATGLIQFIENTAQGLGTSTDELSKMTAVEQLDYVEKYFQPYKGKLDLLSDVYMAILQPSVVGKPDNYVMFEKDSKETSKEYNDNMGLDSNGDGEITKTEAAGKVKEKLERGRNFIE